MDKKLLFNRNGLLIKPLSQRTHDLNNSVICGLEYIKDFVVTEGIKSTAESILTAKRKKAAVIMMMGGHVVRSGVQKYIIDLMEKGYISCLAINGAVMIHDFEFAMIGATTESVAKYIKEGQFGLWKETGEINDIINSGYKDEMGMGEVVGKSIHEGKFPYKNISLLAAGYRLGVPVTVHVGIGYDIIHEHPNCDGAATGATSYLDFLRFAKIIEERLENGVVMNFGSSVMAPEVFLKALSMARNTVHQHGKSIKNFTALVCDLYDLPEDFNKEPDKKNANYYFRPLKTMLVRTVADGGKSFYVKGDHKNTIPALWTAINDLEKK